MGCSLRSMFSVSALGLGFLAIPYLALSQTLNGAVSDVLLADEANTIEVVEQNGDSVVAVHVTIMGTPVSPLANIPSEQIPDQLRDLIPFLESRAPLQQSSGSGFLVSVNNKPRLVTNFHVIQSALKLGTTELVDGGKVEVTFPENPNIRLKVHVLGANPSFDLTLLELEGGDYPASATPLSISDSDRLKVGQKVIAIGNPFGLASTVTTGIVSAVSRFVPSIGQIPIPMIQTDAAINPGNSGGPLLNIKGEVIGINTAIFSRSGGYMGIGFAVPINMAMKIKDQLLTDGHVTRGFLGVQLNPTEMDEHMAATFGLDEAGGVLVADVVEDSAADAAGLKAGDVLLKLDDKRVKDNGSFRNTIAMLPPGTRIVLTVFRDGKKMKVPVEIGNFPEEGETTAGDSDALQRLGLSVQDLTQELAERLGYDSDEGVLVTEVREEGPAARRGIRPGVLLMAVNGAPVSNMQSLKKALETVRGDRVRLRVKTPEGHQLFVLVRMEPEE